MLQHLTEDETPILPILSPGLGIEYNRMGGSWTATGILGIDREYYPTGAFRFRLQDLIYLASWNKELNKFLDESSTKDVFDHKINPDFIKIIEALQSRRIEISQADTSSKAMELANNMISTGLLEMFNKLPLKASSGRDLSSKVAATDKVPIDAPVAKTSASKTNCL